MEDKFLDVLNSMDAKSVRSRLEPCGEFLDELQLQGLTWRDIAALRLKKFQLQPPQACGGTKKSRG
jgi:hypothetical protein